MALTRLELAASEFAAGRVFGPAGTYEQLLGTATFAVDPFGPRNRAIVDLELAPRNAAGQVSFSADVRILRPLDAGRANRRLVLDVVNRGNPVVLRNTDFGPARAPESDAQGWLLQQGYTVLACGWQHNVPQGSGRLALCAPQAVVHGRPVTGQVRSVLQVNAPTQSVGVADEPSGAEHVAYPVADLDDPSATLTVRDYPLGSPRLIARDRWSFARGQQGQLEPDRTHVFYADGFVPGQFYEIIYTAQGAPITGLGFAALRDIVSFLRFAPRSAGNPCAGGLDYALAFGGSQTGRLMRHMLYAGFCTDEDERPVFDGVFTLIAGPIRTETNWRFGQPSFIGSDSPGFAFPFTDVVQTDPHSNTTDGLLMKLQQQGGSIPRVMHVNTSAEYCNLAAALIHLTADGTADAEIPDNVRIYHLAGTHHGGGTLPLDNRLFSSVATYYNNSIDYRPLVRAAFQNLDAWATRGQEPPPSRYPKLSDGTLVPRAEVRTMIDRLPGPGMPAQRLYPTQRLNYGPDSRLGRATFPAIDEGSYVDLLPAVDDDGNELSGIRHPEVAVPLATYTGWNPRHPSIGGSEVNLLLNGATIPFAPTAHKRQVAGDPRPSIEERYPSRAVFLDRVRQSALSLADQGYVLESDVQAIVDASGRRYDELMQLERVVPA